MKKRVRIGIDPGKSGYITVNIDSDLTFYDIPLIGKEVDLVALDKIFQDISDYWEDDVHCVLENVHAIYGSAAGNTFTFGEVYGYMKAFLTAYSIPYTLVQPKKWQKLCWEGIPIQKKPSSTGKTMVNDTKKMSLMAANRLFPNVDLRKNDRCKIPHDGKVDSLLLMFYCDKNF